MPVSFWSSLPLFGKQVGGAFSASVFGVFGHVLLILGVEEEEQCVQTDEYRCQL